MSDIERLAEKVRRAELLLQPPTSNSEVQMFEQVSGIKLPKAFVEFITVIGDGGSGPCRLCGLEGWNNGFWSEVELDLALRIPCRITPESHLSGENWMNDLGVEDYERRWDEDEWDPLFGAISIAEFGCGIFYFLVVNGQHKGRIFTWGDHADRPPTFCDEPGFLEWMENQLDLVIAGEPVFILNGQTETSNGRTNH